MAIWLLTLRMGGKPNKWNSKITSPWKEAKLKKHLTKTLLLCGIWFATKYRRRQLFLLTRRKKTLSRNAVSDWKPTTYSGGTPTGSSRRKWLIINELRSQASRALCVNNKIVIWRKINRGFDAESSCRKSVRRLNFAHDWPTPHRRHHRPRFPPPLFGDFPSHRKKQTKQTNAYPRTNRQKNWRTHRKNKG